MDIWMVSSSKTEVERALDFLDNQQGDPCSVVVLDGGRWRLEVCASTHGPGASARRALGSLGAASPQPAGAA